MTTQTMATGTLPSQRARAAFGGITGQSMVPPPTKLIGLVLAKSGEGKSTFLQSIPDAAYFNIDKSSTVIARPPCAIWPGVDPTSGHPIEQCEPGAPGAYKNAQLGWVRVVSLDYATIKEKVAGLIAGAKGGDPFPSCIVFDTLGLLIPLVMDYVTKKAGKESWEDFAGKSSQTAWARVYYEEICGMVQDIRQAGLGCIMSIHLIDKFVTTNQDTGEKRFLESVPSITDTLYSRLMAMAEFVAIVERRTETVLKTRPNPARNPVTGKVLAGMPETIQVSEKETNHYLILNPDGDKRTAKGRGGVIDGQLKLPRSSEGSCWQTFADAYTKATEAQSK